MTRKYFVVLGPKIFRIFERDLTIDPIETQQIDEVSWKMYGVFETFDPIDKSYGKNPRYKVYKLLENSFTRIW